jgi:hypothetical protein
VDRPGAEAAYLEALSAWNRDQAWIALRHARAALKLDDSLEPARLLEGHALVRLGERSTADATYTALLEGSTASVDPAIRIEAARGRAALRQRNARDQVSVFLGTELALRPTGQGLSPAVGYAGGVDVPLSSIFGASVALSGWDASTAQAVIEGPILDVLATAHVPLASSAWAMRLGVGPATWFSQGLITGGAVEPQFGIRSALGFDNRSWSFGGWFAETGGWFWPGFARDLPVLAYTWDVRAGMVVWAGPSRR